MRVRSRACVLACLVGCGRIAFDPTSSGDAGATGDGGLTADAPQTPSACELTPPQPSHETCSDGIDSNCNGMDEAAPLDDGPAYSQSNAYALGSVVLVFTSLTCAVSDVNACGTTGGGDTFAQLIAAQNNASGRASVNNPAVTVVVYSGLCTDVTPGSTPMQCGTRCSDGRSEVVMTGMRDEAFCVVVEQSDPAVTDLSVALTLDGGSLCQ